ncbi:hypothetical protein TNCV_2463911, partial [Trichonephila clavipes]
QDPHNSLLQRCTPVVSRSFELRLKTMVGEQPGLVKDLIPVFRSINLVRRLAAQRVENRSHVLVMPAGWRSRFVSGLVRLSLRVRPWPMSMDSHDS